MDAPRLPAEVERRLAGLGEVDLVVGLPSYQHAGTIEGVVRGLEKAMRTHFPDARMLVVHSDAGSTDGTAEAVARTAAEIGLLSLTHPVAAGQRAAPPAHGVPGADAAFRTVCLAAQTLAARGVLLLGADLRTLPDDRVERLVRPVWDGELDFVVPLCPRHTLDGTLTTCLLYPLTRALYGRAVRQVMTAEAALAGSLTARLCESRAWGTPAARCLPVFLTTAAAAWGVRQGEAWLPPRPEEPREARLDLGAVMSEVVGTAFALAELGEDDWRDAVPGPAPRRLGDPLAAPREAPPANQMRMVAVFRQGLRDLTPIWEQALRAETLADLYPLGDLPPEEFAFSPDLWARVVYDFLLAYRFRVLHRDHLLRSLVPLYLGRVAALARDTAGRPVAVQEREVEQQVQAFERAKGDFVDRWR